MTVPIHFFRDLRLSTLSLILLVAFAGIAGCGSDDSPDVMVSPPGWVAVPSGGQHATSATLTYISNGGTSSCAECHGADLSGGTSKVSCFGNPAGCHHGPVANWATPSGHGATAKKAPGSSGFASCQICHGGDFRTPRGDANRTCYSCHSLAPHPNGPWRSSAGSTHTNTDPSNASVCANCHRNANPGTPDCFNNTLCHAQPGAPHPVGNPAWYATPPAAQPHGSVDNGAKGAPGSTTGFLYCQACHGTGTDFAGGSSGVSCTNSPNAACHGAGVASPHPPTPWRGSPYTHATTDPGNASVCANCHRNANPGTPDCFNNTLCHAQPGAPHPVGNPAWYATPPAAQPHGSVDNGAKGAPGSTTGFLYCQACHGTGTDFAGGSSGVSCTNSPNAACHGAGVASPHPPTPWRGSPYTHATTAPGNASVCANCHRNANPGTPGCFNNTLCHAQPGTVQHPIPYNDASHYAVTSTTFTGSCGGCHDVSSPSTKVGPVCQACHVAASPLTAADCTSCHASPPNGGPGAAYANIAGAHAVHIALTSAGTPISCDTCHNALGPSLLDNNHYNRAKSRVEPGDVAFLTTYNAESGTSSFNSAAFSCSNVSCHGGVARSAGTPLNWRTGTLAVNTACTSCHDLGTAQFNSYNSGEHPLHVIDEGLSCTECHNTTTLAVNHFTNLGTTEMEGPASATIGGGTTSIPAGNYNGISCDPRCHRRRNW